MENLTNEFQEELPVSWKRKIKSDKLKKLVADSGMWFGRPKPVSEGGKNILKINEPLFRYCETLDDYDYAFEPVKGILFELVPGSVHRQGAGISVDLLRNALEVDLYFFPCDYSEDRRRRIPFSYVRVPIVTVRDVGLIDSFVRKYFTGRDDVMSAVIPFSLDRVAELHGKFIDEYTETERICRDAVKGGTVQEKKNCETFLAFIRTTGYGVDCEESV